MRCVSMASRRMRRPVPLCRAPLEQLATPDVVDEHIDVAMVFSEPLGERADLRGIEMVDGDRDPGASETRDELGRFFDSLRTVIVRSHGSSTATRAHDRRAGLAQGGRNAAAGA